MNNNYFLILKIKFPLNKTKNAKLFGKSSLICKEGRFDLEDVQIFLKIVTSNGSLAAFDTNGLNHQRSCLFGKEADVSGWVLV